MPKKPDPRKYEDTKKAKSTMDSIQSKIAQQFGFNPPKVKTSPTPKPKTIPKPTPRKTVTPQEKALDDLMKKRAAASKKTGSWPNYYTN